MSATGEAVVVFCFFAAIHTPPKKQKEPARSTPSGEMHWL
jgi:hypothetical protein